MITDFTERVERTGVIAIFRGVPTATLLPLARDLLGAGVSLMEVALSTAGATKQLEALARDLGSASYVGAGTVTSESLASDAIAAGAVFLVTPHIVPSVNAFGRARDVPVIGGAMTPTEIATARQQGNAFVKVFPAAVLGPGYFGALRGPYPDAKLVAVGGIDAENAGAYIRAGAAAVGVGGALTARTSDRASVVSSARSLVAEVADAKRLKE